MEEYSTRKKSEGLIQAAICLNHRAHSEEEASDKDQVLYEPHMGSSGTAMRNVWTEENLTWAHGLQGSQSTVAERHGGSDSVILEELRVSPPTQGRCNLQSPPFVVLLPIRAHLPKAPQPSK